MQCSKPKNGMNFNDTPPVWGHVFQNSHLFSQKSSKPGLLHPLCYFIASLNFDDLFIFHVFLCSLHSAMNFKGKCRLFFENFPCSGSKFKLEKYYFWFCVHCCRPSHSEAWIGNVGVGNHGWGSWVDKVQKKSVIPTAFHTMFRFEIGMPKVLLALPVSATPKTGLQLWEASFGSYEGHFLGHILVGLIVKSKSFRTYWGRTIYLTEWEFKLLGKNIWGPYLASWS